MGCLCDALRDVPDTYTVQDGDSLTEIVLKLGLCVKGPGSSLDDWADCLKMAEAVAVANNIPWSGPPGYHADLQPGQVLSLSQSKVIAANPNASSASGAPAAWKTPLLIVGGIGVALIALFGLSRK